MQLTTFRIPAVAVIAAATLSLAGCNSGSSDAKPDSPANPSTSAAANVGPVCPLTGVPQGAGEKAGRPALAVKIDNIAPALPQAGLNHADVVVEELVEGGLTRLMAIFQCQSAPTVGPIRSARISDADILALLHGSVLGFSGANPKDLPPIVAHSEAVLISQGNYPSAYHRDYSRPAPHNVFASTTAMLRAGVSKKHSLTAPRPLFHYGTIDPSAKPAKSVRMSWPAASAVWTWAKNRWLRTQDGSPDMTTNGRASTTNVVIMSVNIASTGLHDVLGAPSPLDVTVGSNPVWVLRDGKIIRGTWKRAGIKDSITLVD
ncbi:MAG TPA: DUF3048 domain-containing protein, partial [Gemmataceae bacterium]|nr:DUF3048 domain-containing protein [Gemmataceae bacterium]